MLAFDASQLADLAAMLGRPVPDGYVRFLAAYPPSLATKAYRGLTDLISAHELYVDPADVVGENREARAEECWGNEGESPWVDSHLVIGKDLSGDMIFVDVARDDLVVHRYLLETGEAIEVAPDLDTYATMLATDDPSLRRS